MNVPEYWEEEETDQVLNPEKQIEFDWANADTDLNISPEAQRSNILEHQFGQLEAASSTIEGLHTPGQNSDAIFINPDKKELTNGSKVIAVICDGITGAPLDRKNFTGKFAADYFTQNFPQMFEDRIKNKRFYRFSNEPYHQLESTELFMARYGYPHEFNYAATPDEASINFNGVKLTTKYAGNFPPTPIMDVSKPQLYPLSPGQLNFNEQSNGLIEFQIAESIYYTAWAMLHQFRNNLERFDDGIFGALTTIVMLIETPDDFVLASAGDSPYSFTHSFNGKTYQIYSPDHKDYFGGIMSCFGARFFSGFSDKNQENVEPVHPGQINTLRISKEVAKEGIITLSSDGFCIGGTQPKEQFLSSVQNCIDKSPTEIIMNALNYAHNKEKLEPQYCPDDKTIFVAKFK